LPGARADLLVTLGGASVGDHDLMQSALVRQGLDLGFWLHQVVVADRGAAEGHQEIGPGIPRPGDGGLQRRKG
jgi:hypothetical protein